MVKFLLKLLLGAFIALIAIRIFIPESPLYKNWISPFTEPLFVDIFDNLKNKIGKPIIESDNAKFEEQRINECAGKVESVSYDQSWYDLKNDRCFRTHISIDSISICESYNNRINLTINTLDTMSYYHELYRTLVDHDRSSMGDIMQKFKLISESQQLGYYDFAEMVITFIQKIPYTLLLRNTASDAIKEGGFSEEYISKKRGSYVENVKYGIYSPIEFLYYRKGDCDTRTLLAYSMLTYFGYDVAIINSLSHSMIGINITAQGKYHLFHGKKYFLWETTSPNWQLGQIPPQLSQDDSWVVAFPSKNDI